VQFAPWRDWPDISTNRPMTGLRFYNHTLGRGDALEMIPLPPEPPR